MPVAADFTFTIVTLGCPKNKVDSRSMRTAMLSHGFKEAIEEEKADFIIINSCSFIEDAKKETIDTTFEAIRIKGKKSIKVGLVGCFPERYQKQITEEIPELDFTMGTGKYTHLPALLSAKYNITLQNTLHWDQKSDENRGYSYYRLAKGCSRSCSFCIIPAIRGPHQSASLEEISEEYNNDLILRNGVGPKEAILVSQDTLSSSYDEIDRAIKFFSDKEDIEWIRLHYLFPEKKILRTMELFNKYKKLVPYLDIPFQHVSPRILRAMNRPENPDFFPEILSLASKYRSDMEIRTSFIIGFPGEEDSDVEEIADFIKQYPLHKISLFAYSSEEGTSSESMKSSISAEGVSERINYLRNTHLQSREPHRSDLINTTTKLLIDDVTQEEIIARRAQDSPDIDEVVFIPGNYQKEYSVGQFIHAKLITPMEYDWLGELSQENL